jgi:hypothetical protein
MESLAPIFGSLARIKLLRLFIFNRADTFKIEQIIERAKLTPVEARDELESLGKAGLVRRIGTGSAVQYRVNQHYEHLEALGAFIRSTTIISPRDIVARLKKAGTLQIVVLAGVFTGSGESTADLLVVGDKLSERTLARAVHGIEAELGREIGYVSLSTEEFSYRQGVYDRLLRDIFDYPHQVLLDRVGL